MAEANIKKNKPNYALRLVLISSLIFFGYIGYRYWQIKISHQNTQAEISKFDHVDSEIFDLSDDKHLADGELSHLDEDKLADITLTELKEGGAEFIYQLLLKNQLQIAALRNDLQNTKSEFAKFKTEQKASKIVFIYIDLRQRFYDGEDYQETLKSFETLAASDKILHEQAILLARSLEKFKSDKNLNQNYAAIIADIMATKNTENDNKFLKKIRHNLSKLIVIRKLDENAQDLDGSVRKAEISLQKKQYQAAYDELAKLENNAPKSIADFLLELRNAAELQKIDHEILLYLRKDQQ